jgi:phosphomevalonate kinase
MLKPTKYLNVNVSLPAISCEILKLFKKNKTVTYTDLLNKVIQKKGIESKKVFLPALNFLFLMGKVEYHTQTDIIEYKL